MTHTPPRRDGWTSEKQRKFLETLAECGHVEKAARSVGMSRESAYRLRRRDSGRSFALAWDAALRLAVDRLVDETFELAFEGMVDQVIKDGEVVAERRRKDPRIMLAVIERLNKLPALASAPSVAIAQEFDEFLTCLEMDVETGSVDCACFLDSRNDIFEEAHDGNDLSAMAQLMIRRVTDLYTSHDLAEEVDEDEGEDEGEDEDSDEAEDAGRAADPVAKPVPQNSLIV
jgi:hypothetical protein